MKLKLYIFSALIFATMTAYLLAHNVPVGFMLSHPMYFGSLVLLIMTVELSS
jgi:hypothetical protein